MDADTDTYQRKTGWRLNMRLLKGAAIILPVLFLAALDAVRHLVVPGQLHSVPGLIGFYVLIAGAIGLFAHTIFRVIGGLQQQVNDRNQELTALLSVGRVVTSSLNLDDLLTRSLGTIINVTPVHAAEVWLMEGPDELVLRCHQGAYGDPLLERTTLGVGEGLPGRAAQTREPVVVHRPSSNGTFIRQDVIEAGFQAIAALPLQYQTKLVGVLAVATRSATDLTGPRQLRLLKGIGERLALGIENARLYQQIQDAATLQERERIAREMHDGMGQVLGYVTTQTIAARKLLSEGRTAEAREELAKMEESAGELYADVREGILGLRMASGCQDGLLASLGEYVKRYMEMSGIQVAINAPVHAKCSYAKCFCLSPSSEIQLLRIVQEALTNVRKHSHATAADVAIETDNEEIRVTITDNGHGFDPSAVVASGRSSFGLQTMRERAEAVGGTVALDAAPGQGTRVLVRIPRLRRGA